MKSFSGEKVSEPNLIVSHIAKPVTLFKHDAIVARHPILCDTRQIVCNTSRTKTINSAHVRFYTNFAKPFWVNKFLHAHGL